MVALSSACTSGEVEDDSSAPGAFSGGASPEVRFPAEWEEHESIWMAWGTYEFISGRPNSKVQKDIISALKGSTTVDLLVQDGAEEAAVRTELQADKVPTEHVRFHAIKYNDIWMRDIGALFLTQNGKKQVLDFGFSMWGYQAPTSDDSKIEEPVDRLIGKKLGLPVVKSRLVSEGGALEFNGRGTMISTESVVTQRNPGMSLSQIEDEYKSVFNLKKVIWMKQGVYEDDQTFNGTLPGPKGPVYTVFTTGGHVDEFARFVGPSKVLFANVTKEDAQEDRIAAETAKRMAVNRAILEAATDESGNRLEIVSMPTPDPIFDTMRPGTPDKQGIYDYMINNPWKNPQDGAPFKAKQPVQVILASSYLNFLVTNKVVLASKYYKEGRPESTKRKDEEAKAVLEKTFPGRRVVQIDVDNINIGGGGIHCITQQMPKTSP